MRYNWDLNKLKEEYDVNLDKIVNSINELKAKRVLLQFPEGLKQYATSFVDYLSEKTDTEYLIYLGDCFGACDTPVGFENAGIDLIIQIGHNSLMPNYLIH